MPYQNLSVEITHAQRDAALAKIAELEALLPFLINLTLEERQTLPKMGNVTTSFVEKAVEYEKNFPMLVPPYVDVAEHEKDLTLTQMLRPIQQRIASLMDRLDDTCMAGGSEATVTALAFYNSAKSAAKIGMPGAKTIVDDLGQRFAQSSPAPRPAPAL